MPVNSAEKIQRALQEDWELIGDKNSLCLLLRDELLKMTSALQRIALLADTYSDEHKERFHPGGPNGIPTGWRVAEAMREVANDAVGSYPLRPRFAIGDRVRVRYGADRFHLGRIMHIGGDNGTYYGVKLDLHDREVGYSEYELARSGVE